MFRAIVDCAAFFSMLGLAAWIAEMLCRLLGCG